MDNIEWINALSIKLFTACGTNGIKHLVTCCYRKIISLWVVTATTLIYGLNKLKEKGVFMLWKSTFLTDHLDAMMKHF